MKNIRSDAPRERLIFALDVGEGLTEVLSWVKRLRDHVGCFKVGKEAFTHLGPGLVEAIHTVSYTHLTLPTIYSV